MARRPPSHAADVPLTVDMFRYMAGWAAKIRGGTISLSLPGECRSYTVREPVGVVGQIIPWHFPLLTAAWKLAPALATGCTVVLKAAEQTPLSALRLGHLVQEAGFPDEVVNILTGFAEGAGAPLIGHPEVDKVAFIGSTEVGKPIVKVASRRSSCPRMPITAAPSRARPTPSASTTANAAAPARARERVRRGVERVAAEAREIRLGSGLDPEPDTGLLVAEEQFARVTDFLEAGIAMEAKVVAGGRAPKDRGHSVEPMVLTGTEPDMKVVREEISARWCARSRCRTRISTAWPPRPMSPATAPPPASEPVTSPRRTACRARSTPAPSG